MPNYICPRVSTFPILDSTLHEACRISSFLIRLHPTDCGEQIEGEISMFVESNGQEHPVIKPFHAINVEGLRKYIDVLRQGCPYTESDSRFNHGLDETYIQDTYEFMNFILRANEELPSLFCISENLKGLAMFSLETIRRSQAETTPGREDNPEDSDTEGLEQEDSSEDNPEDCGTEGLELAQEDEYKDDGNTGRKRFRFA